MALACDMRIAVSAANFFYPVMKMGVLPQPSDPVRMRELIGPARTKQILMAGQKIKAGQALEIGLIDAISEDPLDEAQRWANDARQAEAQHVYGIKALIN